MSRLLTVFAGMTLVTAITFQSRINLISNTANVQQKIDEAKEKADLLTRKNNKEQIIRLSLKRPSSSVEQLLDTTRSYYKNRLIPSVKSSWNDQIINFTGTIIRSNLPTRINRFIAVNVFGYSKKQ
ncbi:uncharacterized protein BX663DRAFT_465730 [Cokeromyces recurvatus]|uniref:uncharacterized protein n=1 Tax=Cokeromyces recurvatus TaxID=90255 RepID=UPI00221E9E7A|nr:uncharacterized protein BX663DRAFT_465730 [Cokeromyces recurvatus]KAI7907219.1 hypothetical protein BX663DRAFT_465730 [Cokeromyces recurvatus]